MLSQGDIMAYKEEDYKQQWQIIKLCCSSTVSSEDLWKSHWSFSAFFNAFAVVVLFVCTHSSVVECNRCD